MPKAHISELLSHAWLRVTSRIHETGAREREKERGIEGASLAKKTPRYGLGAPLQRLGQVKLGLPETRV